MKRRALFFVVTLLFTGVVFGQERDEVMEIALTQGYNNGYEQAYSEFFGPGYEPMLGAALAEAGYDLQLQETIAEYNEQRAGQPAPPSYDEYLQQAYDYGFDAGRGAGLEYAAVQPPLPEEAVQAAAVEGSQGSGSEQGYDPAAGQGPQEGPVVQASLGGPVYNPGIIISSSGSVSFEPLQIKIPKEGDTEYYAGSGVQWGDGMELGLSFSIFDLEERYGGQISLSKEYGDAAASSGVPSLLRENTSVWIRPFKWIRLEVGSFQRGIFDSPIGGGEFFTYMGPVEENANNVFQNFRGVQGSGVLVNLYPIPNLALGALVNPLLSARYDNWGRLHDAKDVYKNGQYAAAYTIPNIGTARVQYIGGDIVHPGLTDYLSEGYSNPFPMLVSNMAGIGNPLSLQAAFAYTGIPYLTLDIGLTFPLPLDDEYGKVQRPYGIALSSLYRSETLSFAGRVGSTFLGYADYETFQTLDYGHIDYGFTLNASLAFSYNFSLFSIGLEGMLNYGTRHKGDAFDGRLVEEYDWDADPPMPTGEWVPDDRYPKFNNDHLVIGFGAWIGKILGPASIKIGVAVSAPTKNKNMKGVDDKLIWDALGLDRYEKGPWVITVPIVFSYYL